ncbi:hypothetical protein B0T25DRAFT_571197 [Lasiosphaeria hispida]|uniref:Ndc10 domain-containing protein n=1 Tax=Lasiosphaeria hispida TaxID=260671 RepID=A0AAJ0HAK8_9PEZI|nr:hypothetical protein B0T25DRAFT_571197 [Lasiosphaeria hispida]
MAFYFHLQWDLGVEPFLVFKSWKGCQASWASKALNYTGIWSSKVTHIGCGAGAKMVELKGMDQDQIECAGWWNTDQMTGCYLNLLLWKIMWVMAGHLELDWWAGKFGPGTGQINELAAAGFTDLLFYLCEVALQDLVKLRTLFPESVAEKASELKVLQQAILELADYLRASDDRYEAQMAEIIRGLTQEIWTVQSELAGQMQASMRDLLAGSSF